MVSNHPPLPWRRTPVCSKNDPDSLTFKEVEDECFFGGLHFLLGTLPPPPSPPPDAS